MDYAEATAPQRLLPDDLLPKSPDDTGLLYLSRIPPFMSPDELRMLLSPHAALGRIYLAPESRDSALRRRRFTGAKQSSKKPQRKNYVEGWIECLSRREARRAAEALNNSIVGGKKSRRYHDDIWNIKYLPGFKWHHLTEQLEYEKQKREQRMRAEIMQAKRESKHYLNNVTASKRVRAIAERRSLKAGSKAEDGGGSASVSAPTEDAITAAMADISTVKRHFKQRKIIEDSIPAAEATSSSSSSGAVDPKVENVLSMLFS